MGASYGKNGVFVRVDNCNRFIYEVSVYVKYENIYSMANHKYFSSEKEIPNVIEKINVNKFITIFCEMYSAPMDWIIENDYKLYIKPEKKKRKKKDDEQKIMSS